MNLIERMFIPAALVILFYLMSAVTMAGIGGRTSRMKIFLRCVVVFVAGMVYSMFWHDKLASVFRWKDAWIIGTVVSAIGSILLGRYWLTKQSRHSEQP